VIIPARLTQKFGEISPIVSEMSERVKNTMLNYCAKTGFAFTWRAKTIESLAEKIETGRFHRWTDLDDLFACTVIVPTLAYEQDVQNFCSTTFDVFKMTKREDTPKSPEVFLFDSLRIKATLRRPADLQDAVGTDIYGIPFEVQVRSAFEHAWAVATHPLTYKTSEVDWKRLRLAAQIKATVEQLDTLILSFEQTLQHVQENPWPEVTRRQEIVEVIKNLLIDGYIPSESAPKDLSRFSGNFYAMLRSAGKEDDIRQVLLILDEQIRASGKDAMPRSVSLLQYFLVTLIRLGFIKPPFKDQEFYCHLTSELTDLYPDIGLAAIDHQFDYDS